MVSQDNTPQNRSPDNFQPKALAELSSSGACDAALPTVASDSSLPPLESLAQKGDPGFHGAVLPPIGLDHPLLTREQEMELGRRAYRKDDTAIEALVLANLRLVLAYVRTFEGLGLTHKELVAAGNLGLLEAARNFNPDAPNAAKFSTYARVVIRRHILSELNGAHSSVHVPAYVWDTLRLIRRLQAGLEQQLRRPPSLEEVADAGDLALTRVRAVLKYAPRIVSFDAEISADSEGGGATLRDLHADETQPPAWDQMTDRKELLHRLISELPQRDQQVLNLRFPLDEGTQPRLKLTEAAKMLGLSTERVRQLEDKAIARLRRGLIRLKLIPKADLNQLRTRSTVEF